MSNLVDRIQRLEENYYFQEDFLQKLNSEVVKQQEQLALLQKDITTIKEELQFLRLLLEEKPLQEKPPHYLEKI
ncbi:MAG: SlyX family protein [Desulfovibrionaceae bacterium]|nr:SlyX family protein [Desulfovibrionaceae bacterium]